MDNCSVEIAGLSLPLPTCDTVLTSGQLDNPIQFVRAAAIRRSKFGGLCGLSLESDGY